METHEPCQDRKIAALSGLFHVPQGSLSRANCCNNVGGKVSEAGCAILNDIILNIQFTN